MPDSAMACDDGGLIVAAGCGAGGADVDPVPAGRC